MVAPWQQWPQADIGAVHRDYDIEDQRRARDAAGISASVLVQSQAADENTDWLLARGPRPQRFGRGRLGRSESGGAVARVMALSRRPMLQSLPSGWILDAALEPVIGALLATGLRFDALVTPRQLPDLVAFVRRWPGLPVIVNHCAKPALSSEGFEA